MLALCSRLGIAAAAEDLPAATLREADELFLTSSTRGVQALVRVDGEPVGGGEPGRHTARIASELGAAMTSAGGA